MEWFWLGIGILITVIIVEKGGALGALFLAIIIFGLLLTAQKKGLLKAESGGIKIGT